LTSKRNKHKKDVHFPLTTIFFLLVVVLIIFIEWEAKPESFGKTGIGIFHLMK